MTEALNRMALADTVLVGCESGSF
jgi:hypothetical protein